MNEKDMELLKIVSVNLKKARRDLKISQMELTNRCELSQSYLGEIESCKKFPSLKTLNRLAEQLSIKPYKLLLDEEVKFATDQDYLYSQIEEKLKNKIEDSVSRFFQDLKK